MTSINTKKGEIMNILLTGGLGGFGILMTRELVKRGHKVIATTRQFNSQSSAQAELENLGVSVIEMDVTCSNSVEEAIARCYAVVDRLDVVVNNAGQGVFGLQEAFSANDYFRLFDINVFGVQRVLKHVLPHLRSQQGGLVVNVSSLLGRVVLPFHGPYNASKWALEAMTETYRYELSSFGIDVCLLEPGGYPTSFGANSMSAEQDLSDQYQDLLPQPQFFADSFATALANNPQQDPLDVAIGLCDLIDTPHGQRPLRTVIDKLGMGDAVNPLNEANEMMTDRIYKAFHIDHMRRLNR